MFCFKTRSHCVVLADLSSPVPGEKGYLFWLLVSDGSVILAEPHGAAAVMEYKGNKAARLVVARMQREMKAAKLAGTKTSPSEAHPTSHFLPLVLPP